MMSELASLDADKLHRMMEELEKAVVILSEEEDYATAKEHLLSLIKRARMQVYDTLDLDGSYTLFSTVLALNATGFLYLAQAGESAGTDKEKDYLIRASGVFEMINAVFDPIMSKDKDLPVDVREGLDKVSDLASDVAAQLLRKHGVWVDLDFV